jgi:hypothetical protein
LRALPFWQWLAHIAEPGGGLCNAHCFNPLQRALTIAPEQADQNPILFATEFEMNSVASYTSIIPVVTIS